MPIQPIAKEIREEILEKIKNGMTGAEAGRVYGISSKTIYGWLAKQATGSDPSLMQISRMQREIDTLYKLVGRLTLDLSKSKKN